MPSALEYTTKKSALHIDQPASKSDVKSAHNNKSHTNKEEPILTDQLTRHPSDVNPIAREDVEWPAHPNSY